MENKLLAPLEWYNDRRKVSELIPYEYNPRKRTPERIGKLKESLEKFNLVEIPAINLDNRIIAGHQRVFALFEIGRGNEWIDVRIPNRLLTEDEFKEYNLRSNIGIGEWDLDMLIEHFSEFQFDELGLDLDFELPTDLTINVEDEQDFEPDIPIDPISKEGDFFELFSKQKNLTHRILCSDSRDSESYDRLLAGEKFNLIVTDPPYNIDYEGKGKKKMKIKNDNMKSDDFYIFLYQFYQKAFLNTLEGASVYIWHADSESINFRKAMTDAGFKISQCLIWVKNQLVIGRQDYQWKHEPCLFGQRPDEEEYQPCLYGWKEGIAHNWYSDRKQTTVLEFPKPAKSEEHPTMKPLPLIVYQIKNSSKQRDIVGDLFLGSGTTLIGCEQTWRECRGMEIDPVYVDVIINRWIKYMEDNSLEYDLKLNGEKITKNHFEKI